MVRALISCSSIATVVFVTTSSSVAGMPPVTVGKISSVAPAAPETTQALKREIEDQLAGMDLSKAKSRHVLTASLLTLDTKSEPDRVESTCVIRAELAAEKGGRLEAVFRGQAHAVDAKGARKSAEQAALAGAVHSAIKRLPDAVH